MSSRGPTDLEKLKKDREQRYVYLERLNSELEKQNQEYRRKPRPVKTVESVIESLTVKIEIEKLKINILSLMIRIERINEKIKQTSDKRSIANLQSEIARLEEIAGNCYHDLSMIEAKEQFKSSVTNAKTYHDLVKAIKDYQYPFYIKNSKGELEEIHRVHVLVPMLAIHSFPEKILDDKNFDILDKIIPNDGLRAKFEEIMLKHKEEVDKKKKLQTPIKPIDLSDDFKDDQDKIDDLKRRIDVSQSELLYWSEVEDIDDKFKARSIRTVNKRMTSWQGELDKRLIDLEFKKAISKTDSIEDLIKVISDHQHPLITINTNYESVEMDKNTVIKQLREIAAMPNKYDRIIMTPLPDFFDEMGFISTYGIRSKLVSMVLKEEKEKRERKETVVQPSAATLKVPSPFGVTTNPRGASRGAKLALSPSTRDLRPQVITNVFDSKKETQKAESAKKSAPGKGKDPPKLGK